ncbi:L,D-transpeptidase family protein [Acerihabitans sp. TG2]|uniref:L,D-transpeptidase family protein n=1 Tax=Acerihabitans sp. TG2 TaxID=3096008 RepID=UPI002B229323|nr:L,D-transpeptidase family protein [Acerihabitans sp. TG2]MEA9391101.1 L,D-transpeptidase family protein [Acerihabitans sp. TG2]
MKKALTLATLAFAAYLTGTIPRANATEYALPAADSRIIGENITVTVDNSGGSLEAIAATYKIGLLGMLEANPGTDPYLPHPGTVLTVPTQMLLPDAPREGIVINLAELRLYYYPPDKNSVIVYPIGIGQLGRNTPVMTTSIMQKIPNPTWTPTANIRKHYLAEQGITLPAVVPAGPDNPMGLFALRMAAGRGVYLIHGTNANFGIGMRVSSGCIRLRPDDIEALFEQVPVGTKVRVVNEAVKVALEPDGKRYIEVHQPLSRNEKDDPQTMHINLTSKVKHFLAEDNTDQSMVHEAMMRRSGMPVLISTGVLAETLPQNITSTPRVSPEVMDATHTVEVTHLNTSASLAPGDDNTH